MVIIICAIIKDEQAYIEEWVRYHLGIGFAKIYLYEDWGSTSHEEILKPWIDEGTVELTNLATSNLGIERANCAHMFNGKTTQMMLFDHFAERCKKESLADWVGFFDVDEFLMFNDGYNLEALTREFKDYAGIILSWLLYGANGHIKKPECGVLEAYKKHCPTDMWLDSQRWNHKTLVNVHLISGNCTAHDWLDDKHQLVEKCVHTDYYHGLSHTCFSKAYIAHYYTKSFEEYKFRTFKRGNMGNSTRCFDKFFKLSPELAPREDELLDSVRYDSYGCDTFYLSRKKRLIAGGNVRMLNRLRNR